MKKSLSAVVLTCLVTAMFAISTFADELSDTVAATSAAVALSAEGNAEIHAKLQVPSPCFGTIILVRIAGVNSTALAAPGPWIAASGVSKDSDDNWSRLKFCHCERSEDLRAIARLLCDESHFLGSLRFTGYPTRCLCVWGTLFSQGVGSLAPTLVPATHRASAAEESETHSRDSCIALAESGPEARLLLRPAPQRFQIRNNRFRVLMFHVIDMHRRSQRLPLRPGSLFQNSFALLFRETGKSR
jgi:hypothetical protein